MSADVVVQATNYALDLVDAITLGPIQGSSAVVEMNSGMVPYLVNGSRWVFDALPAAQAVFVITSDYYVTQTITTTVTPGFPDPVVGGPGYLATVTMAPRTGYPFPPTLTRVVAQAKRVVVVGEPATPVPNAIVTLTAFHAGSPDTAVTLTTTDDGQFTYWFLAETTKTPPVADTITVHVTDGVHSGDLHPSPFTLVPNGVNYAPTITLV